MIGDWGKGWEIQVQPVAVQSKPKKDAGCRKEMRERRAFISLPLDPCQKDSICMTLERPLAVHEDGFITQRQNHLLKELFCLTF